MGTGPWPQPPTEAEQLQALMAAANGESHTSSSFFFPACYHFIHSNPFISLHMLSQGAWEAVVCLASCLVGGQQARLTH